MTMVLARMPTAILRDSCRAGELRFDLEPERFLATGGVTEHELDCDNPGGPDD